MTEQDKKDIAAIMTTVLKEHAAVCPHGIDRNTADTLRNLAESLQEGKKTIRQTIYGAVAAILLGGVILALKHLFNK